MAPPLHGGKRRPNGFRHSVSGLLANTIADGNGCRNWIGSVNTHGYGQAQHAGRTYGAHRLMFMLLHPKTNIEGKLICHHCDNPRCINPDHLYAGTPLSNMRDMISRGRQNFPGCPGGEQHRDAKLTEEKVKEIRKRNENGEGYRRLAAVYGVDRTTIKYVVRRITWKHVP